jgi:hypothetical protein
VPCDAESRNSVAAARSSGAVRDTIGLYTTVRRPWINSRRNIQGISGADVFRPNRRISFGRCACPRGGQLPAGGTAAGIWGSYTAGIWGIIQDMCFEISEAARDVPDCNIRNFCNLGCRRRFFFAIVAECSSSIPSRPTQFAERMRPAVIPRRWPNSASDSRDSWVTRWRCCARGRSPRGNLSAPAGSADIAVPDSHGSLSSTGRERPGVGQRLRRRSLVLSHKRHTKAHGHLLFRVALGGQRQGVHVGRYGRQPPSRLRAVGNITLNLPIPGDGSPVAALVQWHGFFLVTGKDQAPPPGGYGGHTTPNRLS